jgi:predicted dehydrogenase
MTQVVDANRRLALGLIGCGQRGLVLLSATMEHPLFEVRAICDLHPCSLASAARLAPAAFQFSSFKGLLDSELDAVLIATPPATHAELSIAALHAGKNVLSEVPAVTSLEEAASLVEVVRSTGLYYALAENSCFNLTIQTFKRFLNQEPFGPYIHGEGTYAEDCREDTKGVIFDRVTGERFWRFSHMMSNYTTHSLGPLIYLTGHRVTHVVSMTSHRRRQTGFESSIASSVLCYTDEGAVFHSFQSGLCPRLGFHWRLTGERGTIESTPFPIEEKRFLLYRAGARSGVKGQLLMTDLEPTETYSRYSKPTLYAAERVMLHEFALALKGEPNSSVDIYSAMSMSLPGVLGDLSVQRDFRTMEMPAFALP